AQQRKRALPLRSRHVEGYLHRLAETRPPPAAGPSPAGGPSPRVKSPARTQVARACCPTLARATASRLPRPASSALVGAFIDQELVFTIAQSAVRGHVNVVRDPMHRTVAEGHSEGAGMGTTEGIWVHHTHGVRTWCGA